ncbi:S8 family serine peptidase [bacterium]|nr:S8 family serine peptidase [bacterium]
MFKIFQCIVFVIASLAFSESLFALKQVNPVRQAPTTINEAGWNTEYPWFSTDGKLFLFTREVPNSEIQRVHVSYIKNRDDVADTPPNQTLPALIVATPKELVPINNKVAPSETIKAIAVCEETAQPQSLTGKWRYLFTLYAAIGPGNCAVSTACNVTEGFPNPESVRSPANAHKVIGVGAVNLQTGVTPDYQGFGPTNDGRYKPDIQAPTDTETACEEGIILPDDVVCSDPGTDFSLRNRFGGTSGAAPYAAGAGALLRNWLRKFNTFDPGQTYSLLILSGTEIEPFEERIGAGAIELPTCGFADWGKVTMEPVIITDPPEPGDPVPVAEVDIPIQVGQNNLRLDAALWWPTEPFQATTDIDLHLIDPFGVERAKSNSIRGVFERTRAKAKKSVGQLEPGTWILRIRAPILFFDKTIYWAANLRMKNDLCIRRVQNP